MANHIFKSLFLLVFICLVSMLFVMYKDSPKYQMVTTADGYVRVLNVKTGQLYFFDPDKGEYFFFNNEGVETYLKRLP